MIPGRDGLPQQGDDDEPGLVGYFLRDAAEDEEFGEALKNRSRVPADDAPELAFSGGDNLIRGPRPRRIIGKRRVDTFRGTEGMHRVVGPFRPAEAFGFSRPQEPIGSVGDGPTAEDLMGMAAAQREANAMEGVAHMDVSSRDDEAEESDALESPHRNRDRRKRPLPPLQ